MKEDICYIDENGLFRNTHLFSEAANYFIRHKCYTKEPRGSKGYRDFWTEERRRCLYGHTIGEVRITGYNYFYLNYYTMEIPEDPSNVKSGTTQAFPKFYDYQYRVFNLIEYCEQKGLNLGLIKVRGCGLSEIAASLGARDFFINNRDRANNAVFKRIVYAAAQEGFLYDDGVITKCFRAIDFLNDTTDGGIRQGLAIANKEERLAGAKKTDNTIIQKGGNVLGVTVAKPDSIRGKRGYKILFEESGAFKKLTETYNVALPLVRRGGAVTGMLMCWGTSNSETTGIEGFKKMIHNPSSYKMVKFKNVWDGVKSADDLISIPKNPLDYIIEDEDENGVGFFIPSYAALFSAADKDGNIDWVKAYKHYEKERNLIFKGQSSADARSFIGDHAFTLKEALQTPGTNDFDQNKLYIQYEKVVIKKIAKQPEKGFLEFVFDDELKLTRKIQGVKWYPNEKGNILILEHPQEGDYKDLYISGIDSIDQGKSDSTSGSSSIAMLVKKRMTGVSDFSNIYVAQYVDRPNDIIEGYLNCLKLAIYFNAKINLEYTKIRIIDTFKKYHQDYRFIERPQILVSDGISGNNSRLKGTPANAKAIQMQDSLIKEYISEYYEFILFEDMILQLRDYNKEDRTKSDLVVAMGLCELADNDMDTRGIIAKRQQKEQIQQVGYYWENGIKRYGIIPKTTMFKAPQIKEIDYIDLKDNVIKYYE